MLPTQKTPPKQNLHEFTVLLYGPTKFGKSELCSKAESALFLETEPGLNSLNVYKQPIGTWADLLIAAKEIGEGKHPFKTIILDTVDNAYRMCAEHVNQKFKVEHESDLEYGKGYAMVNNEFHRVINKLGLLPYGLFLISHSQDKEIETRTGKLMRTVPTLPDKARKIVLGLVDIILYCDFEPTTDPDGKPGYRRVMRTKPTVAYEAGDRTRRLPATIDFNFAAFAAAFADGAPSATASATPPPITTTPTATPLSATPPATTPASATTPANTTPAPQSTTPSSPEASAPTTRASTIAPPSRQASPTPASRTTAAVRR